MSLSVTQRAMLKASEPVAAGPTGLVIAFDYEIVCQRAANDEELQLSVHNNLSRMIKDYAPDPVYITRESWPELRRNYLTQAQEEGTENPLLLKTQKEKSSCFLKNKKYQKKHL